jgi:ribonuclease D
MSQPLLSDDAALAALAAHLDESPWIALDTEFLRERTYRAQLCLLQLATPSQAVLVDPLADISPALLKGAINRTDTPKILHAARQDLEVLWPVFGPVGALFDTQLAAAFTGMPTQIGYSDLVQRLLSITLTKGETRTDWSKRPLSEAQLRYALDDVVHLAALRDALSEQLERLGRLAWLHEDLREFGREETLFIDPERAVERLRWSTELDPDRTRLAQRLAAWRERRAIEKDRPRSWILDDAALRAVVLRVPRSSVELATITELAPGFVERSGGKLLELIAASELPERLPPPAQRPRPDPAWMARVKHLGSIVQAKASELGLEREVLATRRELESIARGETTAEVLQGWRRSVVGEALLAAG